MSLIEDGVANEISTVINPFYVFNGTVDSDKFIELQIKLISTLGPEDYFQTQLTVLHSTLSKLLKSLHCHSDCSDNGCEANVNIMGNA